MGLKYQEYQFKNSCEYSVSKMIPNFLDTLVEWKCNHGYQKFVCRDIGTDYLQQIICVQVYQIFSVFAQRKLHLHKISTQFSRYAS